MSMATLEYFFIVFKFFILPTIASAVGFILKYYYDKRRIFLYGSKLPGPKPWPLIGNAWCFSDPEIDILAKLQKFRGFKKLFAVWFGHELNVFIQSADFAEILCKSKHLLYRSKKYDLFKFAAPTGLFFTNGAEWKKPRKLFESGLSFSLIKNYIPIFQIQAETLVQRMHCEVGKTSFSVLHYVQDCIYDMINDITFEHELKAQRSEIPELDDFEIVAKKMRKRYYNILYKWDWIYKLFPEGKEFFSRVEPLINLFTKAIAERKEKYEDEKRRLKIEENEEKSKKKLYWQILLDDETFSNFDLRDQVITLIVSGLETTTNATSCAIILLALHPDVQEKVYQEISTVLVDGDFTEENILQLKYLDMVIKETLRLYPSAPLVLRIASADIQMGEHLIPKGADVILNLYELHRDPDQFDDPYNFNPEHFLPENASKRHPYAYIPFASGIRNCPGSKLATMVMKILIAKLLLSFKFECNYKTIEDIKIRGEMSIVLEDGGQVKISQR